MANVLVDETSLQSIANTIREKNGTEDMYKPGEMSQGVESVYYKGYEQGQAEGGRDDLLPYITNIKFNNSISEVTKDVTLNLLSAASIGNIFDGCTLNFNKLTIRISNLCNNMAAAFRSANSIIKEIEIIGDTSNITSYGYTFSGKTTLERIIGELDFSSATVVNSIFSQCQSLMYFKPKASTIKVSLSLVHSPNLTNESIDAIVNGFADMTEQTTPVLTVHPAVKAKIEADDQKEDTDSTKYHWLNILTNKNVTLA